MFATAAQQDNAEYGKDFGGMIFNMPISVVTPTSIKELQQFLQLANQHKIKITCRGKGNSVYGQAQVKDGVVIDLKDMAMDFVSDDETITIPAYKTWQEVTDFTKMNNQTIPVTVDNLDLTVGGTLSFAALGGTSYRVGAGIDNVISLNVMTLDGKYLTCSPMENKELYDAVLGGLGQFAIIINVTVPLIPAKKLVNMHLLTYDNAEQFFKEQKILHQSQLFDHLKGFARKNNDGKWEYVIEAVSYYDDKEPLHFQNELNKLTPREHTQQEMSYWDFINMVTKFVEALRASGSLDAPHPWYNVLMPEHAIAKHLTKITESPFITGAEPIIVYPMHREHFKQPLMMKPEAETFYLLGALLNTSFIAKKDFPYQAALENNKKLYLSAREQGGCRYPVDAIDFTQADWQAHYAEHWQNVCALKEKYDPNNLLASWMHCNLPRSYSIAATSK